MKLSLDSQDGVQILRVTESVDSHNFQVLKAGVTKILRDGKNRIILSLENVSGLESDVLREIAILDLLAKELSGTVVIAATSAELKQQIQNFSKPPVINMFPSEQLALEFFRKKPTVADLGAATATEELPEQLKELVAKKDQEIEALKAKLKALDPKELQRLRGENVELKGRMKEMETTMQAWLEERRMPVAEEAYTQKILSLEETVKSLNAQMKAAEKK